MLPPIGGRGRGEHLGDDRRYRIGCVPALFRIPGLDGDEPGRIVPLPAGDFVERPARMGLSVRGGLGATRGRAPQRGDVDGDNRPCRVSGCRPVVPYPTWRAI